MSEQNPETNDIARLLLNLDGDGAFAAKRTADPAQLEVSVRGFGKLPWPVTDAVARKLYKLAQPARHGYKTETRLDKRVRDTWEITPDRLEIGPGSWPQALEGHLDRLRRDLGLPKTCRLKADLHNLLIYTPGQFFAEHQDSQKSKRMVGTLVVVLPSRFSGGELVIKHRKESLRTGGSAGKLTLVAFYADCRHETLPVKSGHRLALTYNLLVEGDTKPGNLAAERLDDLTEAVRKHFSQHRPPRWSGDQDREIPGKLVYLLDHEYTPRDLSWKRLKNGDARRAGALREATSRLDCEIFLALADVHETWSCEEEFGGYDRYRYDDDDEDSEEDGDGDSPELIELIDDSVELRHFVDEEGRKADSAGAVEDGELICTVPSSDFQPFRSEHEGYMGNYGNTADRWYHRAAVVMWPKQRAFAVRSKQSPRWALRQIASTLKRKEADLVRDRIRQLLPLWENAVGPVATPALLGETLDLAARIRDPKSAQSLLAPFTLSQLASGNASHLIQATQAYGPAWSRGILRRWTDSTSRYASLDDWIAKELPGFCRKMAAEGGTEGRDLARELLPSLWKEVSDDILILRRRGPKALSREHGHSIPPILSLLECGGICGDAAFQRAVTGFLTEGKSALPVAYPLALLHAAGKRGRNSKHTLRNLGLQPLVDYCRIALRQALSAPLRARDDWSITASLGCSCNLCKKLDRFLKASREKRLEWPLVAEDRGHMHAKIEDHELPIAHATRRTGRPYTLILEKTQALFAGEAKERAEWKKQLAWLKSPD